HGLLPPGVDARQFGAPLLPLDPTHVCRQEEPNRDAEQPRQRNLTPSIQKSLFDSGRAGPRQRAANDPDEAGEAYEDRAYEGCTGDATAGSGDLGQANHGTSNDPDSSSNDADLAAEEAKLEVAGQFLGQLMDDTQVVSDVSKPIGLRIRAHDAASMERRPRVRSSSSRRPSTAPTAVSW